MPGQRARNPSPGGAAPGTPCKILLPMRNATLLEELRSLETALHKDETSRNRQRMETLLHADFVEVGRSGRRYTRSEILEEFALDKVLPARSFARV